MTAVSRLLPVIRWQRCLDSEPGCLDFTYNFVRYEFTVHAALDIRVGGVGAVWHWCSVPLWSLSWHTSFVFISGKRPRKVRAWLNQWSQPPFTSVSSPPSNTHKHMWLNQWSQPPVTSVSSPSNTHTHRHTPYLGPLTIKTFSSIKHELKEPTFSKAVLSDR